MVDSIGASRASGNAFASLIGGAVGRYHLLHHVASSDLARQFFARTRHGDTSERIVVVRIAKLPLGEDPRIEDAIVAECEQAMPLRDRHLVVPLEVAREKVLYTASEYIEGASIGEITDRLRDRDARMPASIAVRIALDVLAGLAVAHSAGLVHGGIAPDSVWVGSDGVARLTDFGAHHLTERRLQNPAEPALGQLAYLSPEQVRGEGCQPASDVFSLAAVLWEAMTGRRLFLGKSDADTKRSVLHARVMAPSQRAGDVPEVLDAIFLAALDRDPASRPSVDAMKQHFEQCGVIPATTPQLGDFVSATCVRWLGHQRGLLRAHAVEAPTSALRAPPPSSIDAILPASPVARAPAPGVVVRKKRRSVGGFVALAILAIAAALVGAVARRQRSRHGANVRRVEASEPRGPDAASRAEPSMVPAAPHDDDASTPSASSPDAGAPISVRATLDPTATSTRGSRAPQRRRAARRRRHR